MNLFFSYLMTANSRLDGLLCYYRRLYIWPGCIKVISLLWFCTAKLSFSDVKKNGSVLHSSISGGGGGGGGVVVLCDCQ